MSAPMPPGKHGVVQARCGHAACGWVWIVCYLPMPLDVAGELMKAARCPACGGRKVFVA